MQFFAAVFNVLSFSAAALAAPAVELSSRGQSGSVTYFNPGLGACGQYNGDGDYIVAVSAALFDQQHPCGRRIRVYGSSGSVDVTVVDRCTGCSYNDLDLSPAAFQGSIGDLGIGRRNANWDWI